MRGGAYMVLLVAALGCKGGGEEKSERPASEAVAPTTSIDARPAQPADAGMRWIVVGGIEDKATGPRMGKPDFATRERCKVDSDCTLVCGGPAQCCPFHCHCSIPATKSERASILEQRDKRCKKKRCPGFHCRRNQYRAACRQGRCVTLKPMGP